MSSGNKDKDTFLDTSEEPMIVSTPAISDEEPLTIEERLDEIIYRCHLGTRRMNNETFANFARRVGLDIEHWIAFLLHYLQEVEAITENEERAT